LTEVFDWGQVDFKDKDIEAFWYDPVNSVPQRVTPVLRKMLFRKLQLLDAASHINDLRVPPGNHLKKLSGNREGQYSIRVNLQWRLCFYWTNRGAEGVEFDDYH